MRTRAAGLPADSTMPQDKPVAEPKRSRTLLWVAVAAVVLSLLWWVRKG